MGFLPPNDILKIRGKDLVRKREKLRRMGFPQVVPVGRDSHSNPEMTIHIERLIPLAVLP